MVDFIGGFSDFGTAICAIPLLNPNITDETAALVGYVLLALQMFALIAQLGYW